MTTATVPLDEVLKAHATADFAHGRIADIEVLRAIAILFVLVEHARINLYPWIWGKESWLYVYFGFWNGVDLFLAISGFVIARSLLPTLQSAKNSAEFLNATLAFWVRRIWRLLPSAWLWLAIILVCAAWFNRSYAFWGFRANFEAAVAAILDVANFRVVAIFGKQEPGAAFPYWSLSLEEQFYLLLPLVVFASRRRLPYLLISVAAAQLFIDRSGPIYHHRILLLLNQIRSDALCLGVLIALWSRHPTYRLFEPTGLRNRPWLGVTMLSFLVLLLAAVGSPELHILSWRFGLVALISAVMVLIASYDRNYLFPDGSVKRILLWIGTRSYGLYLVHIPVYFGTHEIWFRLAPPGTAFSGVYFLRFTVTAAVLLVTLTELNYRFVEIPLRRRGARIAENLALRPA
ncbi:MAG TPA: acyltransferase [Alphaproteobacteria bacterium]|jgi:peptidoglycan/LPS O-acetylase OafA/YrhL|nr:acyltransferase [Alphaproteobacteria bacterium]